MGYQVSGQIADRAYTVTASDTADNSYSYLYVGTAGNVSVVTAGGDTVTFNSVPAGGYLWIRTSKVRATSTTASNILGFT